MRVFGLVFLRRSLALRFARWINGRDGRVLCWFFRRYDERRSWLRNRLCEGGELSLHRIHTVVHRLHGVFGELEMLAHLRFHLNK